MNTGIAVFNRLRTSHRRWHLFPVCALTAAMALGCGGDKLNAQESFELGKAHQMEGRLDDALLAYTDAIDANPDMVPAIVNRGNTKLQLGAIDGALIDYKRALELEPNHFGATFNCGIIHFLNGELDQALEWYNRAIELNGEAYDAYVNRGTLYYAMGRLDDAINDYTLVIERGDDPDQAFSSRGNAFYDNGDYERALADYAKVENDPYTPFRRWLAYQRLGRPDDADREMANYLPALSQSGIPVPDEAAAIHGVLSRTVDEDQAVAILEEFERDVNLNEVTVMCYYLGSLKLLVGDDAAALEYFRRGTKADNLYTISEFVSTKNALRGMESE